MRVLCLDVGNSSIKCAVIGENFVLGREELPTASYRNGTSLIDMVKRVSGAVLSIDAVTVSSVVPLATPVLRKVIEEQLGAIPSVIDHSMKFPFELDLPQPEVVGTDRFCAAAGALGPKARSAVVVDVGTAITVDLVHDGVFRGGVISAGPALILDSLFRYASKLPRIDFNAVETPFPRRFGLTKDAMTLGAGLGCVGGIRESVRYLEKSFGTKPRKFLTGGQGRRLAPRLPKTWKYDRDLTLKGIYRITLLNQLTPE